MSRIRIGIIIVFILSVIYAIQMERGVLADNESHHDKVYLAEKKADRADPDDIEVKDGYGGIKFYLDETDEQIIKDNGQPDWAREYLSGDYAIRYALKNKGAHRHIEWLTIHFTDVHNSSANGREAYEATSAEVEDQTNGVHKRIRLHQASEK